MNDPATMKNQATMKSQATSKNQAKPHVDDHDDRRHFFSPRSQSETRLRVGPARATEAALWLLLSSFALLLPGCGGGDDDSDGGGGMSADGLGGSGNGGSGNGDDPLPDEAAPTCDDGKMNGDESDVDCGGSECPACEPFDACREDIDCQSGVCAEGSCALATCGDGEVNDGEDCDAGGESTAACNADCTTARCGDGFVNEAADELCEPAADAEPWARCNASCGYGVPLDGTWPTQAPGGGSPWETLAVNSLSSESIAGLQSYHYSGSRYLYDFTSNARYDIQEVKWAAVAASRPASFDYWENGAVDSSSIYVPRGGEMHRFALASESWSSLASELPDGSDQLSAAVFDGAGRIWYHADGDSLVRFDPVTQAVTVFAYGFYFAERDPYETRLAYDPLTDAIVLAGYEEDSFLIFDQEAQQFFKGSSSPGGNFRNNTCQDRAGGVFVGSDDDPDFMYRYDISADSFTKLPELPKPHDNNSSCVVSEDGYLYYATELEQNSVELAASNDEYGLYRLALGKR